VTFGLTSTDILFHMGAEEISWWVHVCSVPNLYIVSRWCSQMYVA
jgi:hypothetical protein